MWLPSCTGLQPSNVHGQCLATPKHENVWSLSQTSEDHEGEVHALFAQAEREVLAEDLSSLDTDTPAIEVNGICYHRALCSPATYQSAVGPVRVQRTLYRHGKEPCIVPIELRAGIVEGYWTPRAAKQAVWMVGQMPPGEALMKNMDPSESALARLPGKFNEQWEQRREPFECIVLRCRR